MLDFERARLHRRLPAAVPARCSNSRTASCWSPARPVPARPPRCTPRCRKLNTPDVKIITVEDPVEYQIEGINQIQAKPQIGLDFAHALRSIVRQDPDIIMIGEMRDLETARIAIQSALTGHLVLSHAAHQQRRRRHHAPARHGRRGLPADLDGQRHPRAAPGAPARADACRALRGVAGSDREVRPAPLPAARATIYLYRPKPSALSPTGYLGRTHDHGIPGHERRAAPRW